MPDKTARWELTLFGLFRVTNSALWWFLVSFRKNFFFDVSLFAILYGSLLIEMFHISGRSPDSHIVQYGMLNLRRHFFEVCTCGRAKKRRENTTLVVGLKKTFRKVPTSPFFKERTISWQRFPQNCIITPRGRYFVLEVFLNARRTSFLRWARFWGLFGRTSRTDLRKLFYHLENVPADAAHRRATSDMTDIGSRNLHFHRQTLHPSADKNCTVNCVYKNKDVHSRKVPDWWRVRLTFQGKTRTTL